MNDTKLNTNTIIWRQIPNDYYSPTIHFTEYNNIGIQFGGYVLVAPVEKWYKAGKKIFGVDIKLPQWKRKLALWLLGWEK